MELQAQVSTLDNGMAHFQGQATSLSREVGPNPMSGPRRSNPVEATDWSNPHPIRWSGSGSALRSSSWSNYGGTPTRRP